MMEKWKKRSTAGSANRKLVLGNEAESYVRHTGGCVSFEIHRFIVMIEFLDTYENY